jgi:hypothetical protein
MSSTPTASHGTAEPAADELRCAHCEGPIRPCDGETPLEKWKRPEGTGGCRFGLYVHADGQRAGSHLCGKDTRVATPATVHGGR